MQPWFSLPSVIAFAVVHALATIATPEARAQAEISLDQLPPPPEDLQQLIESGRVRFRTGVPPLSSSGDGSTSTAFEVVPEGQRASNVVRDRDKFAAETHFHIEFSFQSHATWRTLPDGKTVRVAVRLSRFKWQPSHTIWLRRLPDTHGFWTNPLVLHEFDHVRISNDPRFQERFKKLTHRGLVFEHALSNGEKMDSERVRQLADQHVQSLFQESQDLIRIRYGELDLQTGHGTLPLRKDSPLYQLLRATESPTAPSAPELSAPELSAPELSAPELGESARRH